MVTEQELKDKLIEFRRWLEDEGHPQGTIDHRMHGACRFALFLAGQPLHYGERSPAGWCCR